MKKLTLQFTLEELGVLTTLASDQLFRRQFIDPKMPGFIPNAQELTLCKDVVGRLRSAVDVERGKMPQPAVKKRAAAR